jgi:general secretion pathway protein L
MLNLNSTIDLNFKQFYRWWMRELSFLIPEKIRLLIGDKQGVLIINPMATQLEIIYSQEGSDEVIAVIDRGDRNFSFQRLYEQDERLVKAPVILRLTNEDAIQKELSLPIAAKENLKQVIGYELDRYTPFKAEQVYFAVKLLPGVNEPGQLRVMLILTPREILDALFEDVKALGLSPLYVDYQGLPNDLEDPDYNLLPEHLRQKISNTSKVIYSALAILTSVLILAVMAMPVFFEYQSVNELQQRASLLEKDAKKVKTMQASIDAVIDETNQLLKEKKSTPEVINMMNVLSSLIKEDTWLSYAQYSEGHLQIQGESPAASGLLGALESSDLFVNARFASPVTQDRVSQLERFQITVDVEKTGDKTHE